MVRPGSGAAADPGVETRNFIKVPSHLERNEAGCLCPNGLQSYKHNNTRSREDIDEVVASVFLANTSGVCVITIGPPSSRCYRKEFVGERQNILKKEVTADDHSCGSLHACV